MLGKKVGIDLGTTTTRIIVKGEGMIASEPTAIAIRDSGMQQAVFGDAAFETAAEDPEFQLRRPIAGGEVADAASARWLVNHAMIRAAGRQRIFKPDVVIAVMSSLPGGQRRSLLEAAALAGARTAYLLDAPLAAAMGAGIRLSGPNGHLVVDVGAGKTDIAALALEGTVSGRCLAGHGGMRLHACVDEHVRRAHGMTLDAATVEELIAALARVGPHEERRLDVRGEGEGGEASLTITSAELNACLDAHVRPILAAIDAVIADTPERLMGDIKREGILLCGGGAQLEGLDDAIAAATGIEVHRESQPQLCAVRGTGYALDNLDVLKRALMYIR
ncbi:MAG: rod shape-determining protein [Candidatus Dormiibacterota bacterium]